MSVTQRSFLQGQPPIALIKPINPEKAKYEKAWKLDDYRKWSPGKSCVPIFLETAKPKQGETMVDWGCGTGKASLALHEAGLDVTPVDFVTGCLDDDIQEVLGHKFIEHDLSKPIELRSDYGFCCDVLEHVPEEQVDAVLETVLGNSTHVFFQISTVPDHFGSHIGEQLHVTVKPYNWWLRKFAELGCIVHHSNEFSQSVIFYVTGHQTFRFKGVVNIEPEIIERNMRANAELGLPQISPHEEQDAEIMLLSGGPSLNDYWDEIIANRPDMPLVTVNGTYNAAIERGLKPSLQFVIDGRGFNKRFVEPLVDTCKYVVASQCDPELVRGLPRDRTYLWQITIDPQFQALNNELWGEIYKDWYPCPGGSTVTLRALCVLQMMGFRKIHLYGFDSCLRDDAHHAYSQPENDSAQVIEMRVGKGTEHDRTFKLHPWMATQAKEFEKLTRVYFQDLHMDVKGDGLIAHLIKTGAALAPQGVR